MQSSQEREARIAPKLLGKVVIKAMLKVQTGLRIGAATSGLEIGGLDNPVVRDPITEKPYIPGSSLKGKLRSLLTRANALPLQRLIAREPQVWLHWCTHSEAYQNCIVCPTFGETPEAERWRFITPGRLIVRDAPLCDRLEITDEDGNVREIMWDDVTTDLPYTEVKMEVAIDIVTAASNPRQMERVPPGALFDCEMLFAVFDPQTVHSTSDMEKQRLHAVLWAMRLLEDDYIGSSGTRGYGKVIFKDVTIKWRPLDYYKEIADEETLVQQVSIEQALQRFEEDIAVKIWHEGATG